MIWLDFKIFGNGWGLASPHFDDVFYWLDGRFYHWLGGLGAQLESFEWTAPRPGTTRELVGEKFRVFQTRRRWLRVRCSWAVDREVRDFSEVRQLKRRLQEWGSGHFS